MIKAPPPATLIKIASLLVHVQEATSPKGHAMDLSAIQGLAQDSDIKAWLATVPAVLLPVRR